ncbi:MAG: DNA polymerase Y family protein, partial [Quisquiliibacterium sp.]
MLWLGLFLPRLPIEIFLQETLDTPESGLVLAVCDRYRVLYASAAAQALGVRPGLKRATALALASSLHIVERAPAREQNALERLASWALQFTPCVSLQIAPGSTRPGSGHLSRSLRAAPAFKQSAKSITGVGHFGLLLEIEPSLKLFGGRDALIARVRHGIAQLGFCAQLGCAPTAGAAWLFSRHGSGALAATPARMHAQLAQLPVELLEHAAPQLESLHSIGVGKLGELAQLPRAGLARRFGKELLS